MPKITKEQLNQIQGYIKTLPEDEREEKLKEIMSQFEQEPQCPFCLMSENKIQTTRIYEDENFMAVLEINPANKGHAILFPKRHAKSITELNEQETEDLTKIIKKLTCALEKISEGLTILLSQGRVSSQRFDHLVINLIPRSKNDSIKIEWQPEQIKEPELEKIKQNIIENFPVQKKQEEPVDEERIRKELARFKKRLP